MKHFFLLWAVLGQIFIIFAPCPAEEKPQSEQVSAPASDYPSVTNPCHLQFPLDHGAHPEFRTEWWYYTGNVTGNQNHRFGYQFTIFRTRLTPPAAKTDASPILPQTSSAWRTPQVYMAHVALSDITGKHFLYKEQLARGALGLSGAVSNPEHTRIFIKSWFADIFPSRHMLSCQTRNFSFNLNLISEKPLILHGNQGYSRKGPNPDQASCYYSFSRLKTKGEITLHQKPYHVSGLSWMDHEFGSGLLSKNASGWDWFSLQLDNQTDIMVFTIRNQDQTISPSSSGTLVQPNGHARHFDHNEFILTPQQFWTSHITHARYPSKWRLQIIPFAIDVLIQSNLPDQELITAHTTSVIYWEGSVSVSGQMASQKVNGSGYAELTGYAGKFDSDL